MRTNASATTRERAPAQPLGSTRTGLNGDSCRARTGMFGSDQIWLSLKCTGDYCAVPEESCRKSSLVTLPSNWAAVAGSSRLRLQSANPNQRTLKQSTSSGLRPRMPTWVGYSPQMQHASHVTRTMLNSASVGPSVLMRHLPEGPAVH
jgi:hypothetical protein